MDAADPRKIPSLPDMTLPDRGEFASPAPDAKLPDAIAASRTMTATGTWNVGERVLAPWESEFLYVGIIEEIEGGEASIDFDDGDVGWVALEHLRKFALPRGQKIFCRRQGRADYVPGEVGATDGDSVCVDFADGVSEWSTLASVRIACQPLGGASNKSAAERLAWRQDLEPGQRVWAVWQNGVMFVGRIDQVNDIEAHVHFDDGDRGWVRREQLLPFEIGVGLRVMGRWKGGNHYYPGTVDRVDGDKIHIQYDDGDREWASPAALAIFGPAVGPDARPTKTAWRIPWTIIGWIVFGVGLCFLRSCR